MAKRRAETSPAAAAPPPASELVRSWRLVQGDGEAALTALARRFAAPEVQHDPDGARADAKQLWGGLLRLAKLALGMGRQREAQAPPRIDARLASIAVAAMRAGTRLRIAIHPSGQLPTLHGLYRASFLQALGATDRAVLVDAARVMEGGLATFGSQPFDERECARLTVLLGEELEGLSRIFRQHGDDRLAVATSQAATDLREGLDLGERAARAGVRRSRP